VRLRPGRVACRCGLLRQRSALRALAETSRCADCPCCLRRIRACSMRPLTPLPCHAGWDDASDSDGLSGDSDERRRRKRKPAATKRKAARKQQVRRCAARPPLSSMGGAWGACSVALARFALGGGRQAPLDALRPGVSCDAWARLRGWAAAGAQCLPRAPGDAHATLLPQTQPGAEYSPTSPYTCCTLDDHV
jgi:hypothetical protein